MTGASDNKVKGKMLKLLKNDFLASARVIPLFYLIEIVSLLTFVIGRKIENSKMLVIGVLVSILVAFLLVFVTFFFVVYDYQKSLFGQQGYLSFTLPVNSRELLGSKLIVYGLWMLVSFADFVLVLDFLGTYVDKTYGDTIDTASSLLTMFASFPSKAQIITYAVYFIIEFFALVLTFIMMIYFSIALSHIRQFQKANVMWAVIIFVICAIIYVAGITMLEKYLGIYLVLMANKSFTLDFGDPVTPGTQLSLMPFVFMVVMDVAYFFLTAHIMHKRINIK